MIRSDLGRAQGQVVYTCGLAWPLFFTQYAVLGYVSTPTPAQFHESRH